MIVDFKTAGDSWVAYIAMPNLKRNLTFRMLHIYLTWGILGSI